MSGPQTGAAYGQAGSGAAYERHRLPAPRNGRAGRAGDVSFGARPILANRDNPQRHDRPRRLGTRTPDQ